MTERKTKIRLMEPDSEPVQKRGPSDSLLWLVFRYDKLTDGDRAELHMAWERANGRLSLEDEERWLQKHGSCRDVEDFGFCFNELKSVFDYFESDEWAELYGSGEESGDGGHDAVPQDMLVLIKRYNALTDRQRFELQMTYQRALGNLSEAAVELWLFEHGPFKPFEAYGFSREEIRSFYTYIGGKDEPQPDWAPEPEERLISSWDQYWISRPKAFLGARYCKLAN